MKKTGRVAALLAVAVVMLAAAPAPSAQRMGRVYYEDSEHGYRFKFPDDWKVIPPQPTEREGGVTCKMEGDEKLVTVSGRTYTSSPELTVLRFEHPEAPEVPAGEGGLANRVSNTPKKRTIKDVLPILVSGFRDLDMDNPVKERDFKASHGLTGLQQRWTAFTGVVDVVLDTYTYELEDADICLVFMVPDNYAKKWLSLFEKVGRTMQPIKRTGEIEFEKGGTYADILHYHEQLVERTPGWRVVPTPSQKFVIKTSSDNDRFIEEVIERLELSRALFEEDFPPEKEFDHVSVVRVCGTEEEFHKYGNTGRGVGGWFSPRTTELVLFDYKNINRNATYAVMSHEAFHQYCHFLFDQSEAHRWFDEGHGDYYGGVEFKRGRATVTPKMPAGFDRLGPVKQMVNSGDYAPLDKHLNYTHQEWQGQRQGFSYAQSWSIIYMLRQGSLGEVSRKIWKDEYADILPNYMVTLHEGFKQAYAKILEERETAAKAEGRELDAEEREIDRSDLDPAKKDEIWKAAMDASWGQIDLDEFEESWLTYVKKHL